MSYFYGKQSNAPSYSGSYPYRNPKYETYRTPVQTRLGGTYMGTAYQPIQRAGGRGGQPGYQGMGEFQMPPEMQAMYQRFAGGGAGGAGVPQTDITTDPYAYPEDVQSLMGRLGERGQEFLSRRPGYGEATMGAMFGQDYDRLRQAGLAQQQATMEGLQAGGQLGTGAQADIAQQMAWGQQKNIGDLMRDIALREEEQKRADLYGYTGAAQDITGQLGGMRMGEEEASRARQALGLQAELGRGQLGLQGQAQEQDVFRNLMAYQQMIEQMNAARRGESRQGFQDFMRYMGMNM